MCKYTGACTWGAGNLACSPRRMQMFTEVNHDLQPTPTIQNKPKILLRSYRRFEIWCAPNETITTSSKKKIRQRIERMCGHDIWLKRSQPRHDKAIIIRIRQASVNNLKAISLEKGHAVRAFEETNTNKYKNIHVRQTLVPQCPYIALVEAHRVASKYKNIHEDHGKYAAVMPTATPL
ncbi:hypothetical protein Cgig2_013250 [Carnegiea gigantea]|uniref:Uncharacterized protein n=1 Tax=Carnegiea gigantea TaxID=171969 RepID=A0A9Q1JMM3_9CARY|nr:hypothetical protein Cgig2_013250 [Carnegiea gigantea]